MKSLNEHINNSLPSGNHYKIDEAAQKTSKMYFENVSSFLIYKLEVKGQISDGYWENARPYNHWRWLNDTDEVIGDKDGQYGYTDRTKHQRKYSLDWIRKNVKNELKRTNTAVHRIKHNEDDYHWIIRVFNFAKFGSVLSENEAKNLNYEAIIVLKELPREKVNKEELKTQFDEKHSYRQEFWKKAESFFTDELLEKYYNSKYNWSQFEYDLNSCSDSINTYLGPKE